MSQGVYVAFEMGTQNTHIWENLSSLSLMWLQLQEIRPMTIIIITLGHAPKGYGSHSVCVCVCLLVPLGFSWQLISMHVLCGFH
jgi:hypothetical protein